MGGASPFRRCAACELDAVASASSFACKAFCDAFICCISRRSISTSCAASGLSSANAVCVIPIPAMHASVIVALLTMAAEPSNLFMTSPKTNSSSIKSRACKRYGIQNTSVRAWRRAKEITRRCYRLSTKMFPQRECICVANLKRKYSRVATSRRHVFAPGSQSATASTRSNVVFNELSSVASIDDDAIQSLKPEGRRCG